MQMMAISNLVIYLTPDHPPSAVSSTAATPGSPTHQSPSHRNVVIGGVTPAPLVIVGAVTPAPIVQIGAVTPAPVVQIGAVTPAPVVQIGPVTPAPVVQIGPVTPAPATTQPTSTSAQANGQVQTSTKLPTSPTNPTQSATTTASISTTPPPSKHMVAMITQFGVRLSNNVKVSANGKLGIGPNESTIVITINNPTESDAGKYECLVGGVSNTGPLTHTYNTTVSQHNMTSSDISSTVTRLENAINEIKQRWERVDRNKVFHHSTVFRKRKYSLSRRQVEGVDLCQFICSVQGGYLAEINNKAELDFVKNFTSVHLHNVPNYPEVFLGATDHGQNNWTFLTNSNDSVYLPGQGIASNGYNCMTLSQLNGFNMNAYECDGSSRFLCEIPVL